MSNPNTQLLRQWHIVQYLIQTESYLSSNDVLSYIQSLGLDASDRTIQRDLVILSDIFPIECRKDDKPYSWRWQRLPNTKKSQLSYEQAIVLTLVDSELKPLLPDDLLERLRPLFIKAKMHLAGIDYTHTSQSDENVIQPNFIAPNKPQGLANVNISPTHLARSYLNRLIKLKPYAHQNTQEPWQYMVQKQDILELQSVLKEQGLDSMAQLLSGLEKKLKSPK